MDIKTLVKQLPPEKDIEVKSRPYFNHSVEFKSIFTAAERAEMLESVGLNVFYFPSEMITGCDMLSDSGTTTMSNEQWAALHMGDEAYGSNRGYYKLKEMVDQTFGEGFFEMGKHPNAFIFHQGRSSEDALFSLLGKTGEGLVIPSNGHFDTTEGNIQANRIEALNLFSPAQKDVEADTLFKGDMDSAKLRELLEEKKDKVPVVYLTITNNTGGGQPVSMKNIKEVHKICREFDKPLFFDACRFAENAWFVKLNEKGYDKKTILEITQEAFSYCDGFTISFKKDGLVNMGGGLFIKKDGLFLKLYPWISDALMNLQIMKEGHSTYGGMSGRDIMALVVGLKLVVKEEYLTTRIGQTINFGNLLGELGIPIVRPPGGHAVYVNTNRFFEGTSMKPEDFGGVALSAALLAAYGHRGCELGYLAFGSYDPETGKDTFPEVNYVRLAIPRLRYEWQDLQNVAYSLKALHDNRDGIPPVKIVYGRELPMRHFKARFEFV